MWISPNHPDRERLLARQQQGGLAAAEPPDGDTLAELPRGRDEVLRVSVNEYEGHRYVALRVFAKGPDGRILPVRGKGCSVRLRECEAVADALNKALDLAPWRTRDPR